MIVQVGEKVRVRKLDQNNWGIEALRPKKDPLADPWVIYGYYGTLPDALGGVLTRYLDLLSDKERVSLSDAVELICQAVACIPHLLPPTK